MRRGFTIIEVVVIVAVLLLVGFVALPYYERMMVKARQTEAKNTLALIFSMEQGFYQAHSRYTDLPRYDRTSCEQRVKTALGFRVAESRCADMRYAYEVKDATNLGFKGRAEATTEIIEGCSVKDSWQVNEKKIISPLNDVADPTAGCP